MTVEQVMAKSKRARDAHRKLMLDMAARGEMTMAGRVMANVDKLTLEATLSNSEELDVTKYIVEAGGIALKREELPDYGIDPAVLYLMNEEESFDPPGTFYGFDDGSIVLLEND